MIKKSDLKLVKHTDPILSTPPLPFEFNGDIDAEMFANIMIERMKELGGVGLSANQVGINRAMFVMGINEVNMAVFNPKIVGKSKEEVSVDEGCLTYPGVYVKVKRPVNIQVEYQNAKGEKEFKMLTGLSARIFQHEFDHMGGLSMKDQVSKLKWDLAYNRMIKRTKKIIRANVQKQLLNISNQVKESKNV